MTSYEIRKRFLLDMLETYRDTPPDTAKRRFVDWLMKRSRDAVAIEAANGDETGKKYHNLIALRYITDSRPSKLKICKVLHISRASNTSHKGKTVQCWEAVTDNAVDRLLLLAFGVDGMDWGGASYDPAPSQNESAVTEVPPRSELVGKMMELEELKYDLAFRLLAGMKQHIRENTELSAEERSGIIEAIKTAQAQLVLCAFFDL